ncbi:hypothetical protein HYS95_03145 [Candidatus Daviesbacteria bacterium]|nr:hypothetical protein [Candidatus Daviesbacteria bacterium]
MPQESKEILLKVLEIINYKEKKEEFINQFLTTVWQNTILDFLEALPNEQKQSLDSEVGQNPNPENQQKILMKYFPQEKIRIVFRERFREALEGLLASVNLTLSQKQQAALTAHLSSVSIQS